MIPRGTRDDYLRILRDELVPALGCTDPIAIAFASATARELLGTMPDRIEMRCSGNIIKNARAVTVPNTGGMKGIETAAIAGVLAAEALAAGALAAEALAPAGNQRVARLGLRILETMPSDAIDRLRVLRASGMCSTLLAKGTDNLHIHVKLFAGESVAEVVVSTTYTGIVRMVKDGAIVFEKAETGSRGADESGDRRLLNVRDIIEFSETVDLDEVRPVISNQIERNTAISDEGLSRNYGMDVGRTLLKIYGNDVRTRAKARAAAGSDARMSGCSMPVVINSGSGNQGLTASLPVVEYAKELKIGEDRMHRALVLSNLIAIHQKTRIGSLSAYCGAVCAACGSGAAIAWMDGGSYEEICGTITNTIANIGGMVCDGAKPSCAAKIASAVDAAIMAWHLSAEGKVFGPGEGLVKDDIESTIESVGRMGSIGMKGTDAEILDIMIGA
ncbi:MAG: hypothetical protein A2Z99_19485 [Treponema sp. GWB1_62_6]|nr:MAG: hypothetical protein A2001_11945 [Treponema sp. GWC1_61_84]OHE72230.1 MAG: hypothetical protein A2Z99_19485 [Treponema sp. GWB1_62_6]OHE72408.1 MAG: hypothetical protein A2413_03690 [Treponema sp. RIFOXYC1_FULL_61_9]HCM28597.1 hypothetical protein [Treponema sp.]